MDSYDAQLIRACTALQVLKSTRYLTKSEDNIKYLLDEIEHGGNDKSDLLKHLISLSSNTTIAHGQGDIIHYEEVYGILKQQFYKKYGDYLTRRSEKNNSDAVSSTSKSPKIAIIIIMI